MSRRTYRVLSSRSAPLTGTDCRLWTIDVQEQRVATAPTLTLQVESAAQPYALGAVVELTPDWLMEPTPTKG